MGTAIAATLAVAVFLAVASVVFVLLQRQQLEDSLTDVARRQAVDVAGRVAQTGVAVDLVAGGGDQSLIQVVDASGSVVAASPSIEGEPPVISQTPSPEEVLTVTSGQLPIGEGDQFVVVAHGTASPDGPMIILAAQSLEVVAQSTAVVGGLLAVGYPLVLLAVGLTSYSLTGRALAPVDSSPPPGTGTRGRHRTLGSSRPRTSTSTTWSTPKRPVYDASVCNRSSSPHHRCGSPETGITSRVPFATLPTTQLVTPENV